MNCLQLDYGLLTCCLTNMTPYRPAAPRACRAPLTSGLKFSPMWVHIHSIFLGYQLDGCSYFGTPASMQHTAHEVANASAKQTLLVVWTCHGLVKRLILCQGEDGVSANYRQPVAQNGLICNCLACCLIRVAAVLVTMGTKAQLSRQSV